MKIVKIVLVIFTAIFMAFHAQIFISRIEPNPIFSWLASLLVEGFLVVIAISKRTLFRYVLLLFLYLISVVSASASFLVTNENLLENFLAQKTLIAQLKEDLERTRAAYAFGEKYTTKTLQRERALMDEMREMLRQRKGYLPVAQAVVFFIFCLALQTASVYTAATLKLRPETPPETVSVSPAVIHPDTPTVSPTVSGDTPTIHHSDTPIRERVKELRRHGLSIRQIASEMGLSVAKVQRLLR